MKTGKLSETQMRKEAERLQEEIWKIDQARAESKNKKLIGKCFKYRNHFSSPSEGWWLYAKVIGVDGRWCIALDFQKKEDGTFEIRLASAFTNGDGWSEIEAEEFDAEWYGFLAEIEGLRTVDASPAGGCGASASEPKGAQSAEETR